MFFKYISVGVINTIITIAITFFCYKILLLDYLLSYTIGFFAGFVNSLVMNNNYTFKDRKNKFNTQYLLNFSIFFGISFLISEGVLILLVEFFQIEESLSIIASMIAYTIVSYFLFKKFVFKKRSLVNAKQK